MALESTYGTPVTPTDSVKVRESDGIQASHEVIKAEGITGTPPKNKAFYKGLLKYEGGFEFDLYPKIVGYFLKSAFGAASPTLQETGVYKHTFSEAVAKPGVTLEQKIGQITKRFAGYAVDTVKIAGKTGETIKVTVSGKAKTQADATAISAAFETSRPLTFVDVASFTVNGTDLKAYVDSFEIEYKNNLEMFYSLGSQEPSERKLGASECSGKATLYLDTTTKTLFADLLAGTERAIVLTITGDLAGATKNYQLVLTMSKCALTKFETPIKEDYVAISLEWDCREDSTNGLVKIELQNTTASY